VTYATCKSCWLDKPTTELWAARANKSGLTSYCKPCTLAKQREWRAANMTPERRKKKNAADRVNYGKFHDEIREAAVWQRLRIRYNLSREEYEVKLEAQHGVCALCGEVCKTGQRLVVDHCHATGQNRGLLCKSCNFRLGIVELEEWVTKAQAYIKFWKSQ
jgi:hypothetical protein